MKVLLKRDLFLGRIFYSASRNGTEVPDFVDGKAVVLADYANFDPSKHIKLPKDAIAFSIEAAAELPKNRNELLRNSGKQQEKSLSELKGKL